MIEPGDILPVHAPWPLSPNKRPASRRRPRDKDAETRLPAKDEKPKDDEEGHVDEYA